MSKKKVPKRKYVKKKKPKGRVPYTTEQKKEALELKRFREKATRVAKHTHDVELEKELIVAGEGNKVREAELRVRLGGQKIVERLNWIVEMFTQLDYEVSTVRNTKQNPHRLRDRIRKNTVRGQLLKTQADILFKKLGKLLPDVKSVEFTSIQSKPSKPEHLSEEQLLNIIQDNVSLDELMILFPQFKNIAELKGLKDLKIPDMAN